jgi:hypothetical protein
MIAGGNINCFAFCSRMKYDTSGDADGRNRVRWLAMCNPRAQYVNRVVCRIMVFDSQNFHNNPIFDFLT